MKYFLSVSLISLLIISTSSSCNFFNKEDIKTFEGNWTVEEAQRDGIVTSLLDGANFQVTPEGQFNGQLMTMITNKENNPSVLNENKIEFPESPEFFIEIVDKSAERMHLKFKVKESDFEIKIQKTK